MVLGLGNSIVSGAALDSGYVTTTSWDFDGLNDHINLSNDSSLKVTATDTSAGTGITVSAWVYKSDWSGISTREDFVSTYESGVGGKGWSMYMLGNAVHFEIGRAGGVQNLNTGWRAFAASDGSCTAANPHCRASGWHHISFTFDGRYFKSFVDGGASNNTNSNDAGSDNNPIQYASGSGNVDVMIGGNPSVLSSPDGGVTWTPGSSSVGVPWEGLINEVAIWNKALDVDALSKIFEAVNTDGAVLDLTKDDGDYDYSSNLIGLWRATEAVGTTAVDATGNNDGSIKNSLGTSSSVPS